MDKICIRRLEVFAHHGVYDEENRLGQKFYVSVEMGLDTRLAGTEDDIKASVNYGRVCTEIVELMQSKRCKLIEAAAENIATALLIEYTKINEIKVEIEKPSAPVPYSFDTVSVSITRRRHRAYLSIGSNLGDRQYYLAAAIALLKAQPDVWVCKESPLYETEPYGYVKQPPFLNGCLEIQTLKTPTELLQLLNGIERELGRTREIHWGPRTVDLDIIFYDEDVIDTEILQVPHKDMANRLFVLKPLADIAAFYRHPLLKCTVADLLKELERQCP